jgi:hypothetical protein
MLLSRKLVPSVKAHGIKARDPHPAILGRIGKVRLGLEFGAVGF